VRRDGAFEGWEAGQDLLDFARAHDLPLSAPQLSRLHRADLIAKPRVRHLGRGRGTESLYPPGTKDRLLRVQEVRRLDHRFDDIAWRLWWEDGGPLPVRVRKRLIAVSEQWERERRELADVLAREDSADPDAIAAMDETYRSAEQDRAPSNLGRMRRNVGPSRFATVVRVFAEVATGRFCGYLDENVEDDHSRGAVTERALGVDRARADHFADGEPWFEGSSEIDLMRLSDALGKRALTPLATAADTDLDRVRSELRSLWRVIETAASLFERLFGPAAFGFGTVASVFRSQPAQGQALLLLMWLALRGDADLRDGMEALIAELPAVIASSEMFEVINDLREQVPAFAAVMNEERLAAALLDGAQRDALIAEISQLGQAHASEFERFATRHPELDELTAIIEAA